MRYSSPTKNSRRVLCIFPAYMPSFGTFAHAYRLMGVSAFMPPQGLLTIAAYLPAGWEVRFVDENIGRATTADFAWADLVMISGMHIQAPQIRNVQARARAAGKITVLGGPSVSGSPEMYPEFDYLHIGELGNATDRLIRLLDDNISSPADQVRLETSERLPLSEFPVPAYEHAMLGQYLLGSIQFSSGCPYRCEFCDIPALYGRQPRLKSPEQIIAELDVLISDKGCPSVIYFVDDNFIGNRKAARDLLPHLISWQERHDFPLQFACEATLNIAKQTEFLRLMREAAFTHIFVGIETPELDALKAMGKEQNATMPMAKAIATLNSFGLEVTSGIILGLDTDTNETEHRIIEFIDRTQIPVLTLNLLQALPRTPLWDRLARDNRIVDDLQRESNVDFLRPYDQVLETWRRCIAHAYDPKRLFARYMHQVDATYPHRLATPIRGKLSRANLRRGAVLLINSLIRLGVLADYRRTYWRATVHALKRGQINEALGMAFAAHHLIVFSREAIAGEQNASFYSTKQRNPPGDSSETYRRLFHSRHKHDVSLIRKTPRLRDYRERARNQ
jgi:hopanoid C-2 methylase